MNAAVSLFSRAAHRSVARASCPAEVRDLAMEFAPLGADFLLLLVDECLDLVEAWRLARREGSGVQGFPISIAIGLALRAKATGMIVAQERITDLVPRRPDIELTHQLKKTLRETGIELLDHFLLSGNSLSACRTR